MKEIQSRYTGPKLKLLTHQERVQDLQEADFETVVPYNI